MIAPWNQEIYDSLTQEAARRSHAWLFAGPTGLGKNDLAVAYAERLLQNSETLRAATHPDFHVVIPEQETDPEGELLQRYGMRYYVTRQGLKPKSVISVDQVRELRDRLVIHGHGAFKLALITPAHLMNSNAANALLKILEEPPSGTVFVLVTERSDLLPATIRSRCSTAQFRVPVRRTALQWLSTQLDENADPELLLSLADGAPLRALELHREGFVAKREKIVEDFRKVTTHTVDVVPIAASWKELGIGESLGIVQRLLADMVKIRFVAHPPHLSNPDQLAWLQHAAKDLHLEEVYRLINQIGVYLRDTNAPLDQNLVLEEFLLELGGVTASNGG